MQLFLNFTQSNLNIDSLICWNPSSIERDMAFKHEFQAKNFGQL